MTSPLVSDAELAEHRADELSMMRSACSVRRRTGRPVQDESSGLEGPGWVTVLSGVRLRLRAARSRTVKLGGVEFEEASAEASLPFDVADLADGDLLEVTAGDWPGSVWRVVEAVKGDQLTARRVPVVEVARPEEWD